MSYVLCRVCDLALRVLLLTMPSRFLILSSNMSFAQFLDFCLRFAPFRLLADFLRLAKSLLDLPEILAVRSPPLLCLFPCFLTSYCHIHLSFCSYYRTFFCSLLPFSLLLLAVTVCTVPSVKL